MRWELSEIMSKGKRSRITLHARRQAALRARLEQERREREERERQRLEAARRAAEGKVELLAAAVDSADADFVDRWTGKSFSGLKTDLERLQREQGGQDPSLTEDKVKELDARLAALKQQANEAYEKDQRRREIVSSLRAVLQEMGWHHEASLSDVANPAGDVVVRAKYASAGQSVEAKVDLEVQDVRLDMDDDSTTGSANGSDCAKTLAALIDGLNQRGADMIMTDTGTAGPRLLNPAAEEIQNIDADRGDEAEA